MAKFLTFYPIGSISDANLGLSPDSKDGTVINTLDKNIVYRIQLNNQKQIQSWTSEQQLSGKVVYDFKSKKYVGVFLNRHLRCWGEEDSVIGKAKTKIPRSLKEIISFDNKHTILVYVDGTCESLENRLENKTANWPQIVDHHTHQITNIACFNTSDNHVMLTYFVRNTKTGAMEFIYFLLNDDDLTPNVSVEDIPRIKIARKDSKLSGFTVVKGEKCPSLMTIWSDKRIFMLSLCCNENTPTDFGAMVAMFDCLKVDAPLTFLSVNKNCVAIYGGNTKQDGASLVLYNTRHHIVDSMQHFKVHLNNCRLWLIGEFILMAVGQRLTCAPFRISQEKLIDIVGSKRSVEWKGQVNKDCINEESEIEENVFLNKEMLRTGINGMQTDNDKSMTKIRRNCQSDSRPEIYQDYNRILETLYRHNIAVEIIQNDSLPDSIKATGVVHPKDQLATNEEIALTVETLAKDGRSETEITEIAIPLLIKSKSSNGLADFLRKTTNISERMLAESLNYFVSMDESDEKLEYINRVFACSFDTVLIKEHLRTNLKLDNAIYLLELIHDYLNDNEFLLEESPQYGHHFDSDMALINWFVAILEAHYPQFLLVRDPNVNEMIVKWQTLIESFVSGIHDLKPVTAKITNLVNGKWKENGASSSKWYSVERVQLYKK